MRQKRKLELDMGTASDDELEECLVLVRAIARMTLHGDKPYDDVEDELLAFDAIIRNARRIIHREN